MLRAFYSDKLIEAGCDEAGRGSLAGPVCAAAVILPKDFNNPLLNDSKQLTAKQREQLRVIVEKEAVCYKVIMVDPEEIDEINILNASFTGMHRAIKKLSVKPELLLVDGNRFNPYPDGIPHKCIIQGDGIYQSIAAASILAKTYRDELMARLHQKHPEYNWKQNKGYATHEHRKAINKYGISSLHRRSFNLNFQAELEF